MRPKKRNVTGSTISMHIIGFKKPFTDSWINLSQGISTAFKRPTASNTGMMLE